MPSISGSAECMTPEGEVSHLEFQLMHRKMSLDKLIELRGFIKGISYNPKSDVSGVGYEDALNAGLYALQDDIRNRQELLDKKRKDLQEAK